MTTSHSKSRQPSPADPLLRLIRSTDGWFRLSNRVFYVHRVASRTLSSADDGDIQCATAMRDDEIGDLSEPQFAFGIGDTVRIRRDGHTTVVVDRLDDRLVCYSFDPRERIDWVSPQSIDWIHGPRPEADEHLRRYFYPEEEK